MCRLFSIVFYGGDVSLMIILSRLIPTGRVRWMGHSLVVLLVVLYDTKDRLFKIVKIDGEINFCKVLLWMNLTGGRGAGRPPLLNIFFFG